MAQKQFLVKTGFDPNVVRADPSKPLPEVILFTDYGFPLDIMHYFDQISQQHSDTQDALSALEERITALESPPQPQ